MGMNGALYVAQRRKRHRLRENCTGARDIFLSGLKLDSPSGNIFGPLLLRQFNYFNFHPMYHTFNGSIEAVVRIF